MTQTTRPARRWLDRMFQMRFGVFMVVVAGSAAICWAVMFRLRNSDIDRALISRQIDVLRTSTSAIERRFAAQQLDGVPPSRLSEVVPVLIKAMHDPDVSVRQASILSLTTSIIHYIGATKGETPPELDSVTLALVAKLRDPEATVRASVAQALEMLVHANISTGLTKTRSAVDPKVVVGPLLAMLDDPDTETVHASCRTLLALSKQSAMPIGTLERLTRSGSLDRRIQAIEWLGQALRATNGPLEPLLSLLDDPDLYLRRSAILALKVPWRDKENVAQILASRFVHHDSDEVGAACEVLATISPLPDNLVLPLVKLLESQKPAETALAEDAGDFEYNIAIAITNASKPVAKAALPSLIPFARRSIQHETNHHAVAAILKIDPQSPEVQGLAEDITEVMIGRHSRYDTNTYVGWLKLLNSDLGKRLVPTLRTELADNNPYTVHEASKTLEALGPLARDAAPHLAVVTREWIAHPMPGQPIGDLVKTLKTIAPGSPEFAEIAILVAEKSVEVRNSSNPTNNPFANMIVQIPIDAEGDLKPAFDSADPKLQGRARAASKIISRLIDGDEITEDKHVR